MEETSEPAEETGNVSRVNVMAGSIMGLGILAAVGAPIWFFFIAPKLKHDRLIEKGIHVPGRLLSVRETGADVNESPVLELVVEFTRRDGKLDTSTAEFVPSLRTFHMFQPGIAVTATYNPDDPDEITVAELGTDPPGAIGGDNGSAESANRRADSLRHAIDSIAEALRRLKR